jgi:hypothetical protein
MGLLLLLLAGAVGAPSVAPPPVDRSTGPGVPEAPAAEPAPTPEQLYQQGEQAYWLGDFNLAVDRFEAAYAASRLPGLLYNVGLAYLRRFELSQDVRDLHRARAVLRNYAIELEKDPSLGQADNLPKLLEQIDRLLAEHDAPAAPPKVEAPVACPEAPPPPPPAPVRTSRPAGLALMATGSAALAAGVASALVFSLKGRSYSQQLVGLRDEQAAAGCPDMSSPTCAYLDDAARITETNGRRANLLAGGLGGGLSALGLAGLVVGAVVHAKGRPPPSRAGLQLAPTAGGFVLSGRF